MADIVTSLYNFLSSIAGPNLLLLVFLVSLFGNVLPVVPIPYQLAVIGIAAGFPGLGVVQIAAVSAFGAALAAPPLPEPRRRVDFLAAAAPSLVYTVL